MKTAIKTLFITALTGIILIFSVYAGLAKESDPLVNAAVSGCSKIEVRGNITVFISQGTKEGARVQTDEPMAKVSLKRKGTKLMISSSEKERVMLYLTVKDLQRIDAADHAIVRSTGKVRFPVLQIFVEGNAEVEVNVISKDLYTVIKQGAILKLSGSTDRHTSVKDDTSLLNTNSFAAAVTNLIEPGFANANFNPLSGEILTAANQNSLHQ